MTLVLVTCKYKKNKALISLTILNLRTTLVLVTLRYVTDYSLLHANRLSGWVSEEIRLLIPF